MKNKDGKTAHNKLLNCDEPEKLLLIDTHTPIKTKPENINPPTAKEVEAALKIMKNYKACAEDQVFAEIWKYASSAAQISLPPYDITKGLDIRKIPRTMDHSCNQPTS